MNAERIKVRVPWSESLLRA